MYLKYLLDKAQFDEADSAAAGNMHGTLGIRVMV